MSRRDDLRYVTRCNSRVQCRHGCNPLSHEVQLAIAQRIMSRFLITTLAGIGKNIAKGAKRPLLDEKPYVATIANVRFELCTRLSFAGRLTRSTRINCKSSIRTLLEAP